MIIPTIVIMVRITHNVIKGHLVGLTPQQTICTMNEFIYVFLILFMLHNTYGYYLFMIL